MPGTTPTTTRATTRTTAHAGHDHSAHDPAMFRRKFWLSLVLTLPTLVFSRGLQDILGLSGPRFPGSQYIPAVFGVVLLVYGGWVFLKGGIAELRAKQPGMMTLISLAILVAFGYSAAVTLGLHGMDFWWELSTLITIMLLGHWIEMSAVMGAQNALGELAKLLPDEADLVHRTSRATVTMHRPGRRSSLRATSCWCGRAPRFPPTARSPRRVRGQRVAAHRRVRRGDEDGRRAGDRRQHQRLRRPHRAGHQDRRRHRARRHHEARRRGAGEQVRRPGARRPRRRAALLCRARGGGRDPARVVPDQAG